MFKEEENKSEKLIRQFGELMLLVPWGRGGQNTDGQLGQEFQRGLQE